MLFYVRSMTSLKINSESNNESIKAADCVQQNFRVLSAMHIRPDTHRGTLYSVLYFFFVNNFVLFFQLNI